jgi:hypothetical protein
MKVGWTAGEVIEPCLRLLASVIGAKRRDLGVAPLRTGRSYIRPATTSTSRMITTKPSPPAG